jgi:hypothetical protein
MLLTDPKPRKPGSQLLLTFEGRLTQQQPNRGISLGPARWWNLRQVRSHIRSHTRFLVNYGARHPIGGTPEKKE